MQFFFIVHSRQSEVSVKPLLLLCANVSDRPGNITVHLRVFIFWVEDAPKLVGIPLKYFESDESCLYEMNSTLFCMCWLEVRKSSFALPLLSNSICHTCEMHVNPGLSGIICHFIYVFCWQFYFFLSVHSVFCPRSYIQFLSVIFSLLGKYA